MRISLNYDIGKYPDTSDKAGRGCVGRFLQLFAAPAARPAGGLAGFNVNPFGNWQLPLLPFSVPLC